MRISRLLCLFFLSGILFYSCIDEYWPDLEKYENLMVIEGTISNEPGPYQVKLSLSSRVDKINTYPLSNATLTIMDDKGEEEVLTETEPGTYMTSPSGIQGTIGRSYKIRIETADGRIYESEFDKIRVPTEIESIDAVLEYKEKEGVPHTLSGYQFYFSTHTAPSDTNYFLAKLEATYEYHSDFLIRYVYDGQLRPFSDYDSLQDCWRTYVVPEIYTYSTVNLANPVIKNYPLHYVDTETRELFIRYSLLMRQFSLSEKAYRFWTAVKEQNSNQGGLYNTQPYQIRGNLTNINDPEEPALGYFTVAGIASKRIFVTRPPALFYFFICELGEWEYQNVGTLWMSLPSEWPIYVTTGPSGSRALPNQECINCELFGGTIVKPDFW